MVYLGQWMLTESWFASMLLKLVRTHFDVIKYFEGAKRRK